MTLPLANTQEGGTLYALATANSGGNTGGAAGDYFTAVSGNVTFIDQHLGAGLRGFKCVQGPTTPAQAKVTWGSTQFGTVASGATVYTRFYMWWPALPTATQSILVVRSSTAPGQAFNVKYTTTGTVLIQDANGATAYTSTTAIPAGILVRVEVQSLVHATAGRVLAKFYYTDGSGKTEHGSTEVFSLGSSSTDQALRGAVDALDVGLVSTDVGHTMFLSEIAATTAGWVGSAVTPPATPSSSADWRRMSGGAWVAGGQIKRMSSGSWV